MDNLDTYTCIFLSFLFYSYGIQRHICDAHTNVNKQCSVRSILLCYHLVEYLVSWYLVHVCVFVHDKNNATVWISSFIMILTLMETVIYMACSKLVPNIYTLHCVMYLASFHIAKWSYSSDLLIITSVVSFMLMCAFKFTSLITCIHSCISHGIFCFQWMCLVFHLIMLIL